MTKETSFSRFSFFKYYLIKCLLVTIILAFSIKGSAKSENSLPSNSENISSIYSSSIDGVESAVYAGNDTLICSGGTVTLRASGLDIGVTYTWYRRDAGGLVSLGSSNPLVLPAQSLSKTYLIISDIDPANKDSMQVRVPSVTGFTAVPTCNGQLYSLAGTVTYSNPPSNGTMTVAMGAKTQVFNAPFGTSKTYSLTNIVPDGLSHTVTVVFSALPGCTYSSASYTAPSIPVISLNNPTICSGETTQLTASGADTYSWYSGMGTANPISLKPSVTTAYLVTGTLNGCTNTAQTSIIVNGNPVVNITPVSPSICTGQSTSLTADGGTTYLWDTGETSSIISVAPVSTTTYSVTAYSNGCSGVHNISIAVNNIGSASVSSNPSSLCVGDAANLRVSEADSYLWSTNESSQSIYVSPVVTTTYTVTISKAGCSTQAEIVVPVHNQPTVTARSDTAICYGTNTTLTASGSGYAPLRYVWSSTQVGSAIPAYPTSTKIYTVTISDGNGCTQTDDMVLTVNPIPNTQLVPSKTSICRGETLTVAANNADTYLWSGGFGTSSVISVAPTVTTIYRVTGTALLCTRVAQTTVTVVQLPVVSANNPTVCYGSSININASGATSYAWNNGGSTASISVSPSATSTYTVTGTASGCSNTASSVVTVANSPVGGFVNGGSRICSGNTSGTLILSGYTGNILHWESSIDGINWLNIANTSNIYTSDPLSVTTLFRAIVQDVGCPAQSIPDTVFVDSPTIAGVVSGGTSVCPGSTSAELTLSGKNGNVNLWQFSTDGLNWNPIINTDTFYTSGILTEATYFRAEIQNGVCSVLYSNSTLVSMSSSPPGGSVTASSTVCFGSTSGLLNLGGYAGNIIKWQSSTDSLVWNDISHTNTNYTSLALNQTTFFRAQVESGGCYAYSSPAKISVDSNTIGGDVIGGNAICIGALSPTLSVENSYGDILKWQFSSDSIAWFDIAHTNSSYTPALLSQTQYYRAQIQNGVCASTYSLPSKIKVDILPSFGAITGNNSICLGSSSSNITLGTYTGTIIKWQNSLDSLNWLDINNTSNICSPGAINANTYYRVELQNGACSLFSNSKLIQIDNPSVGGIVAGGSRICENNTSALLTLSGNTGSVVDWEYSLDSLQWNSLSHTDSNYTSGSLTQSTYYRAVIQNGVCGLAYSIPTIVVVDQSSIGGAVLGGTLICANSTSGLLTLTGYTGDILNWQSSTDSIYWVDIANTNNTYTSGALSQTTFYRAVVRNGACNTVYSIPSKVVVGAVTIAGTVVGGTSICEGSTSALLTATGYSGAITKWQSSVNGILWNDISNTNSIYTSGALTQTTQFRVEVQSGACSASYSIPTIVTVYNQPIGGTILGGDSICVGSTIPTLTLTGNSNNVLKWQVSTNGVSWTDIANTSTIYTPTSVALTSYYRAQVDGVVCNNTFSDTAVIYIYSNTIPGVLSSNVSICSGANAGTLSLAGYTGHVNKWETSSNGGLSWTDIANTNATHALGVMNTAGTYLYRVEVDNGVCASAYSNNVSVIVKEMPIANFTLSANNVCQNASLNIDFIGTYNSGYIYNWNYGGGTPVASGTPEDYSVSWTTVGNKNITLTVDNAGCVSSVYSLSVLVKPIPNITATPNVQSICNDSHVSVVLSSTSVGATYSWTATPLNVSGTSNGTGSLINQSLLNTTGSAGAVTYTAVSSLNGCSSAPIQIPITVYPYPSASSNTYNENICSGDTISISLLSTVPSTVFNWTVVQNGASGATSGSGLNINQQLSTTGGLSGTVVYTVTPSFSTCSGVPIDLNVTVNPLPQLALTVLDSNGCVPFNAEFSVHSNTVLNSYNWNYGDGTSSILLADSSHIYDESGFYTVSLEGTDANGCSNNVVYSNLIQAYANPEASFVSDPNIGSIFNATINFVADSNAGEIANYQWHFNDLNYSETDTSSLRNPSFKFSDVGDYSVCLRVENTHGCLDSICRNIKIEDEWAFYMPKAFTPNNDGINETFGPSGYKFFNEFYEMYIYNRWGGQVFYTNDMAVQWNGKVNGKDGAPVEGVYTWVVRMKNDRDNEVNYFGTVVLIR